MILSSSRVGTDVHSRHEQWISVCGIQQGLPSLDRTSSAAARGTHLTRREQQVVKLFLEGYENIDIARHLGIAHRTVKACFNRLYLRFGITSGIKRVKLATLLYRAQKASESSIQATPDIASNCSCQARNFVGCRSLSEPQRSEHAVTRPLNRTN